MLSLRNISIWDTEANKRRALRRDESNASDNLEDPDADLAILMWRHLLQSDKAIRRPWVCVCQNCSEQSVRLSPPRERKRCKVETCFDLLLGVRSVLNSALSL